jgi:hypothetical protein
MKSWLKRMESLAEGGLGVYVYYYPSTPLRLAHVLGAFPGAHGVAQWFLG